MTTAIVLLNYNGRNFLQKFLPEVLQTPHATVYVADNCSTDDSMAWLAATYGDVVKTVQLDRNYGFAEGYNRALQQITATYYVLLNTDVAVRTGWLAPLIALLDSDATVAAVQPKVRAYSDPQLFEHAGGAGGYIDALGYPYCMTML
jgi:GT2 family glycosyltransferase